MSHGSKDAHTTQIWLTVGTPSPMLLLLSPQPHTAQVRANTVLVHHPL